MLLTYVINIDKIIKKEGEGMPRPTKCRRICRFPQTVEFNPQNAVTKAPIILTVDEYEAIRLIDKEGLSQEQCSERMLIARTTVQKIYECARKKIADFLVEGRSLKIKGGEYRLCSGWEPRCEQSNCVKQQLQKIYQKEKGENTMRIAVTYENGEIFQHFGHTEQFKIYEAENNKILSSEVIDTNGSGHGALAEFLHALDVDTLICGGIGAGAQNALIEVGIRLYGGVNGSADKAVEALLSNSLKFNPDVQCNHHEHGEEHSCGSHGCGGDSCGDNN